MNKYYFTLLWFFAVSCQSKQNLVMYTATIFTQDPSLSVVEAMVVHKGTILATGSKDSMLALYPKAKRIDFHQQFMFPGFIDSHTHALEFGQQALKANLEGSLSVQEMIARIQAKYPNPPAGQWLLGYGWDEGVWADLGYPDRQLLDAAFPNNPVALKSLHGFAGFYNAKALEIAGISAESPNPTTGRILRRADGTPTGVMETIAQQLINKHIPVPNHQELKRAILAGLNQLASKGVTMIHEAGLNDAEVEAYLDLDQEGLLPCRVYIMLNGNDDALMKKWFERGPYTSAQAKVWVKGAKIFYDGSLGSRTALLFDPYSDHPHLANMTERISQAKMRELTEQCLQYGFQPAVHAIGDSANQVVLDIYRIALANAPKTDHRWRIEHAQAVREDFYQQAAAHQIYVSMQSSHAVGDSPWAEDRLGDERIRHAYAWKNMVAADVPFILNSDMPGEPWEPMQTLYFAVSRKKLGVDQQAWYPEQAISVQQAISAMTIDGAKAAFAEKLTGSLEVGKKADFVLLDKNPFTIATDSIQYIRPVKTYLEGNELVFFK
jgi:predicted amidohydrolase YtcJ